MPHNNTHDIHLNIAFRNTDASDAIKTYADDKIINSLKKYVHHNTKAHLVLNVEKNRHSAEITFHADGQDFQAKKETKDMYSAIDGLVDLINSQLRKRKEKLTSHK